MPVQRKRSQDTAKEIALFVSQILFVFVCKPKWFDENALEAWLPGITHIEGLGRNDEFSGSVFLEMNPAQAAAEAACKART